MTDLAWKQTTYSNAWLTERSRHCVCDIPRTRWLCPGYKDYNIDGGAFCVAGCPADKDGHGVRRCHWTALQDAERMRALVAWLARQQHIMQVAYEEHQRVYAVLNVEVKNEKRRERAMADAA